MIKLINILKEIKVFKHLRPISVMYNDVKPILTNYVSNDDTIYSTEGGDQYYNITMVLVNEDEICQVIAYDLAKYDGFTESNIAFDNNVNVMYYYNVLAFTFLLKYALEIGVLKFPFHAGFEEKELSSTYNGGDILNNPHLKKLEKYRGQFRFNND